MNTSGIVTYREKIEQVVDKHRDFLGDEAAGLCAEHSIPAAKKLQAELAAIADEDRLLKVGIVGQVNSGKSSLLNALLFEGQSILPKAATPMTAALAVLSHGDVEQAEVEFFTPEDLEAIEAEAGKYERLLKKLTDALLAEKESKSRSLRNPRGSMAPEERDRVRRRAARQMRDDHLVLTDCHEQHEKIKSSGISIERLGESKLLNLSGDLSALQGQLEDYVGADGQYMPFTKSVNIRLPQENLKDIEIVDTPGINDPVQSREARTRDLLNQCDVVLVVSRAGQFMNKVDEDLMDRITSKQGVRELFVAAVQVDSELFASEKAKYDGQLDRVLNSITGELGRHLEKVVADLKERNPEVGNTYDQLLEEGQSRVIHSSALCESLKQRFGEKDGWDEAMAHVWNRLQSAYPDYFSATNESLSSISLAKLSNISAIQSIVEEVRARKQDILKERIDAYEHDKSRSLKDLKAGLLEFAENRQAEIEGTDIQKLKEQRRELETSLKGAAADIEDAKDDSVDLIGKSMRDELEKRIKEEELKGKISEEEGDRTEHYKDGVIFKKTRTRVHQTIRTNAIVNHLSDFSENLVEEVVEKAEEKKKDWRKELNSNMTKILRENFPDGSLEASVIRRVIGSTVRAIPVPDFEYDNRMPPELEPQGVLEDTEAEKFFETACDYARTLCRGLRKEIRAYVKRFTSKMKKIPLEKLLLEQLKKELTALEESIKNKEMELKRINLIKGELERIE